jgi:hypothetical protein
MSLQPVSTFRTLAIVVVMFACGLAGGLLTPRFRGGPPAEKPNTPGAESQLQPADSAGNDKPVSPTGELAKAMCHVLVKVPAESIWDGSVRPTRRVDVTWVRRGEGDQEETIILHNVLVAAVDSSHVRDGPQTPTSVCLEVTPEQAVRLARAMKQGTIKLVVLPDDETGDKRLPEGR